MIEIDGAVGEGGGQILRSALALSLCTGLPFSLQRIRARRPKPGLMRQHLTCVNAATAVSAAEVQGAELNSQHLRFVPGRVQPGSYAFNVGSAGSCTLVLQTVWPALMLAQAGSRLQLGGGTHNPMAPPFHFLARSYAPLLRRLGAPIELRLQRLGFYPAGGGEIEALIEPAGASLQPFDLCTRGAQLEPFFAECLAPALPRSVAQRELESIGQAMGWQGEQLRTPPVRQHEGPGNALMATLTYEHLTEVFTEFGDKGVGAEKVAKRLAQAVRTYQQSEAALGPHLADQWVLPLALAVWKSQQATSYTATELTEHARTNFEVIEKFLPVRISYREAGSGWQVAVEP